MDRQRDLVTLERCAALIVFLACAALVPAAVFRALEIPELRQIEVGLDLVDELDTRLAAFSEADHQEN